MSIFISIVIPIYNAEKNLKKCLNSVLSQSFNDFELLLINDGSTDNSASICDAYAGNDSRIKVFHKKNSGVSAARNTGIDKSSGNLIVFIDSDDFVDPDFLENLFIDSKEADLVISGIKKNKGGEIYTLTNFPNKLVDISDRQTYLEQYPISDFGYPFSKVYKKELLDKNQIRFIEEVKMFEDTLFLFNYIQHCKKIKFNDKSLYNYVISEGESLSTKVNSFKSEYISFITFYNQIINDLKISIPELVDAYPKLGYRLTRLMNRSITTLYIKGHSRKDTLLALSKYPKNSWTLYRTFNEPSNFIKKISKALLERRLFFVADLLLRISYKFIK